MNKFTGDKPSALVQRLAALPAGTRIDRSDSWTEEDQGEFAAHSLKRADAQE